MLFLQSSSSSSSMEFNSSSEMQQQPHHSNPNNISNDASHSQFFYNAIADQQQQQQASYTYTQYSYYPQQSSQNPNPNNSIPAPSVQFDSSSSNASLHPPMIDPYAAVISYNTPYVGEYQAQPAMAAYSHQPTQAEVLSGENTYYHDPSIAQYGADPAAYEAEIKSLDMNTIVPTEKTPTKTNVIESMPCEVCRIDCNSEDDLDQHKMGKKHKMNLVKQAELSKDSTVISEMPTTLMSTEEKGLPTENLDVKITEVGSTINSAIVCSVCKVTCTSESVFHCHMAGKKHAARFKKEELGKDSNAPATSKRATTAKTTEKSGSPGEDLETKKQKIMEADAANPVMVCTICEVASNSQLTFNYHLAGKKHAAQVKKVELSEDSTEPAISKMPTTPKTTKKRGLPGEDFKTKKSAIMCTICEVACNSQLTFDYHLNGKKHAVLVKKEELGKDSAPPAIPKLPMTPKTTEQRGLPGANLETKKQKIMEAGTAVNSVLVCTICEVACNSQLAFEFHLAGKKHAIQAGIRPENSMEQMVPANLNQLYMTTPMVQPPIKRSIKKGPKKTKIVQSAWCEICKIDCTTKDVLNIHKAGKKHKKNLKKLEESNKPSAVPPSTNPIIGPQENPHPSSVPAQQTNKRPAPSSVPVEDVEAKRRKLMEGGVSADSVRVCSICNVVVNSETVFSYHLAGQKHAAMVKKQAGGTAAASASATVPAGVVTVA